MDLPLLAHLHRSMQEIDVAHYRFEFRIAHLRFESLYFSDTRPQELVFGCVAGCQENIAFAVQVYDNYSITPYIQPRLMYDRLVRALRISSCWSNRPEDDRPATKP